MNVIELLIRSVLEHSITVGQDITASLIVCIILMFEAMYSVLITSIVLSVCFLMVSLGIIIASIYTKKSQNNKND